MANKEIRELEIQTRVVGSEKSKREIEALEAIKHKATLKAQKLAQELTQTELAESKKRILIMAEEAKATAKYNRMKQSGFISSPRPQSAKFGSSFVRRMNRRYDATQESLARKYNAIQRKLERRSAFMNRPTYTQKTTYSKSSIIGKGAPIVDIAKASQIFDSISKKDIDYSKFVTPEISNIINRQIKDKRNSDFLAGQKKAYDEFEALSNKGTAFITKEKTSKYIEDNVIDKKNDALVAMKKYYEGVEQQAKAKKKETESIFKTGRKQKFGEQMPYGTNKLLSDRAKEYERFWKDAEAARLQRGKWQSESIKARGRNSMKAYKDRVRKQNESYRKSKKHLYDFPITFKNHLGNMSQIVTQAIGELTMFAGAITMVGFMASSAFQKIMATGDMFAATESKFLVGAGYREHLIKTGGIPLVAQFDRATELQSKLTGQNRFTAAQNLARAGNELTSMGGTVSERALSNIAIASAGTAAITGETSEKMMSKILAVAKKGKDADKIGLGQLKLTKNMNENLEIIAKATKENPIARTAMDKGTVGVAMTTVRESFGGLSGEVFGRHPEQIRTAFAKIGEALKKGLGDPKSIYAWERTLTNLTDMTDAVFTPERITRMSENAAELSAYLIAAAGNLFVSIDWFLEKKDSIIRAVKIFAGIWAAIKALKIGIGLKELFKDLKDVYKSAKDVLPATSTSRIAEVAKRFGKFAATSIVGGAKRFGTFAATSISRAAGGAKEFGMRAATSTARGAKEFGMLGLSRKLAGPLAFLLTHKELGANEDKMLAEYNLRKSLDKEDYNLRKSRYIYDKLNLRKGDAPTRNALDASLLQNDFGLSGVGYKDSGYVNQPMPSLQFPNANYIVVNGDVNMDGSTLSISDRWMQEGAGTI